MGGKGRKVPGGGPELWSRRQGLCGTTPELGTWEKEAQV